MTSTEQQRATPGGTPAEHEVPDDLRLAAEFPAVTRDEWRHLVAEVLRKAGRNELPDPVEEALSVPVATGVRVQPLYTADNAADLPTAVGVPGLAPFVRGAQAGADPAHGVPEGWTSGSGTPTPTWPSRGRPSLPTWTPPVA